MKGHITQKNGAWYFVLDVGYKEDGKRKQKWFKGDTTKPKTHKMMINKIAELQQGDYIEPSKQKYSDYLEDWLTTKARDVKPKTLESYSYYISLITPHIGNLAIDRITPLHVEATIGKLTVSDSTARKVYITIKQSLQRAVDYGLVHTNPAAKVKAPRVAKNEMKYWTTQEVQQFMFATRTDPLWIAFYLALKTGMRQGEILRLKWSDISNNTITVRSSKTSTGVRNIAVTDSDIKELEKHKLEQKKQRLKIAVYFDNDLVVATRNGKAISPRNLLRSFDRIIEQKELRKIRFHDLRHTHATMMLVAGVHVKVISERLGHSSIRITLDTYSHILPNMQNEAASKLEKMLEIR